MIRLKNEAVDLKRTYPRDLWASVGISALLPALVFIIDPEIVLEAMKPARRPVIIELELIPATQQRLPLPPLPITIKSVAYERPVREYELPPVVVTEFPLEAEEEVAEL
jgi:hypothetical protein